MINEGLERNDLEDRIRPTIHIDEYTSKMGKEDQIIVVTFKVFGKQAAVDLEKFFEKGYDWILDAETSVGELMDGDHAVFVEAERRTTFPKKLMSLISDLKNVTNVNKWEVTYYQSAKRRDNESADLSADNLARLVPLSPRAYRSMKDSQMAMESILNSARISRKKGDTDGFASFKRTARD